MLCASTLVSQETAANGYYPDVEQTKLSITGEDYQPGYKTLANLEGIYVNVSGIKGFYSRLKTPRADSLIAELKKRVDASGLKWLSKESVENEPGQPTLSFFPSYKPGCCTLGLWAGFSQGAKVLSAPDENYRLSSWGSGANHYGGEKGASCLDASDWAWENVIDKMEAFLADYERAKTSNTPAQLEAATPQPSCSAKPRLFVEMFDTNSRKLGDRQRAILDELAASISDCTDLRYRIEAHADQRGERDYNLKLSKDRADAIKIYLIASGLPSTMFESRAFGEESLVSNGTSDTELAANRRVVITPVRATTTIDDVPPPSVYRLLPQLKDGVTVDGTTGTR